MKKAAVAKVKKGALKVSIYDLGKPITKVEQVCTLANKGKAIYHTRWGKTVPAAFLVNFQARMLANHIRMGWLYNYKPK